MDARFCRKKQPSPSSTGFGARLAQLRQARGITQVQLAQAAGTTQRAISYYENEAGYPPVDAIIRLAEALEVSADELLGMGNGRSRKAGNGAPHDKRLWKKFLQVANLPEKDQRAVIRLINSLAKLS
jgi:transcriptional regulator with XRE-family HTH domain